MGKLVQLKLQFPRLEGAASNAVRKAFDLRRRSEATHIRAERPPAGGWQIGAIIGPSGSGKTTIARKLFHFESEDAQSPTGLTLVDELARIVGSQRAQRLLGAVGLHSIPAWLRPLETLSTGEQFRARLAISLACREECQPLGPLVIDEFTSVVDRATAASCSYALQKWIRNKTNRERLVVVSAHADFLRYLAPDWVLSLPSGSCNLVRSKPSRELGLALERCSVREEWPAFAQHHYLTDGVHAHTTGYLIRAREFVAADAHGQHGSGICGIAIVSNRPGWKGVRYVHRIVILPQYQGLGIAREALALVADRELRGNSGLLDKNRVLRLTTGHPAMQAALGKDPRWRVFGRERPQGYASHTSRLAGRGESGAIAGSTGRGVLTWQWVGEAGMGMGIGAGSQQSADCVPPHRNIQS